MRGRTVPDNELTIAEGWTYAVSIEKDRFEGIFRGYAMIGSESAIAVQLADGTVRFVPVAKITYMDQISSCDRKRTEDKRPEPAYYG
jgi:hypothetical protein